MFANLNLFKALAAGLTLVISMGTCYAGERGTAQEAMTLAKKAIAYIKANGKEKALSEFSSPTTAFKDRDLYVFVDNKEGVVLANSSNPKMVGRQMIELKDAEGKLFVKELVDVAFGPKGSGWIDYKWPNPVTKAIEQKSTYVERIDDVFVAVGIYK